MSRNCLGGVGRVGRWRRKEERVVWLLGPVSRVDGGRKDPDPVMARVVWSAWSAESRMLSSRRKVRAVGFSHAPFKPSQRSSQLREGGRR